MALFLEAIALWDWVNKATLLFCGNIGRVSSDYISVIGSTSGVIPSNMMFSKEKSNWLA